MLLLHGSGSIYKQPDLVYRSKQEMVLVQIKLNRGLVCCQCETIIFEGSDFQTNYLKLRQANVKMSAGKGRTKKCTKME